jgi:hypothetical protein
MEVLYKDYSFRPYQLTKMAATGKSCFSMGASHQISVHFGKAVSEKIFRS